MMSSLKKIRITKHFGLIAFACAFSALYLTCCGAVQHTRRQPLTNERAQQVDNWLKSTVAFVDYAPGSTTEFTGPFCSGWFVGPRRIISTAHCFQMSIQIPSTVPGQTIIMDLNDNPEGNRVHVVRWGHLNAWSLRPTSPPEDGVVHFYYKDNDIVIIDLLPGVPSSEHFLTPTSDVPVVAERVYSVGHPNGMAWSFADGLISRIVTDGNTPPLLIQATNPTIPGCSGGPLLNAEGQVIGMARANVRGVSELGIFIAGNVIRRALTESAIRDVVRLMRQNSGDPQTQGEENDGTDDPERPRMGSGIGRPFGTPPEPK